MHTLKHFINLSYFCERNSSCLHFFRNIPNIRSDPFPIPLYYPPVWLSQTITSVQTRANPTAIEARPRRSILKLLMSGRNPPCNCPSRQARGTRTSSKCNVAVSEQCQPIFARGVRYRPADLPSTRSKEIPLDPASPVRAYCKVQKRKYGQDREKEAKYACVFREGE